jgi:hypothetical protein
LLRTVLLYRPYPDFAGLSDEEKGRVIPMTQPAPADQPHSDTIECPVCQSHGAALRHDIRASLLYFCQECQHEWQIHPKEEPIEADPTISPWPRK